MLRRNKTLSIVMTLCLCLAMLAPIFVAPQAADASCTYTAMKTETVSAINTYFTKPMIEVEVPNVAALSNGDLVSISLPSGVKMDNVADESAGLDSPLVSFSSAATVAAGVATEYAIDSTPAFVADPTYGVAGTAPNAKSNVMVYAPATTDGNAFNKDLSLAAGAGQAWEAYAVGDNTIEIKVLNTAKFAAGTEGVLYVNLQSAKVTSTLSGDITANIYAPSSSGFSSGSVVFGSWLDSSAGTNTIVKSVKTMGSAGIALDTITIQELVKNSLATGEVITLKLPAGFAWDSTAVMSADGAWGFSAGTFTPATPVAGDNRKLKITCTALGAPTTEGRIYLTGAKVLVDDEGLAKKGEVAVAVSSNLGNVTDASITVANYVDFGVAVSEKTTEAVTAGYEDTELGSFNVKEAIAGSIIPGRTVTLTLPSGVKWDTVNYTPATLFGVTVVGGTDWTSAAGSAVSVDSTKRVLKITTATNIAKSNINIKDLKVIISPEYTGDINLAIAGTAGVEGTVKVATVTSPVTFTAAKAADIVIGSQAQVVGDITITENVKEAMTAGAATNTVRLVLPDGATFAGLPTATVSEGDLTIDDVNYALAKQAIDVVIKSSSVTPSKVVLSGIKITTDRTVPEGPIELAVNALASTALQDAVTAGDFDVENIAEIVIGECVTPAESAASSQFRIGSNIFSVNGIAKVMDVTPYIKDNRTYVPYRFLAQALGVKDADIVWDATANTVTVTKGDKVVVATIGSTTLTVNGEATTMDVAPEITNNRTMLPARFLAEALGATVGWDALTSTVVISY